MPEPQSPNPNDGKSDWALHDLEYSKNRPKDYTPGCLRAFLITSDLIQCFLCVALTGEIITHDGLLLPALLLPACGITLPGYLLGAIVLSTSDSAWWSENRWLGRISAAVHIAYFVLFVILFLSFRWRG